MAEHLEETARQFVEDFNLPDAYVANVMDYLYTEIENVEMLDELPVGSVVLVQLGGEVWSWTKVDDFELSEEDQDYLVGAEVRAAWSCVAYSKDWTSRTLWDLSSKINVIYRAED